MIALRRIALATAVAALPALSFAQPTPAAKAAASKPAAQAGAAKAAAGPWSSV